MLALIVKVDNKNWVEFKTDFILEHTGLAYTKHTPILKKMQANGTIEIKLEGMPPTRFVRLKEGFNYE